MEKEMDRGYILLSEQNDSQSEEKETLQLGRKQQFLKNCCHVNELNFIAPNLSLNSTKKADLISYDESFKYFAVYPGLNIRGICQNSECSRFKQPVWVDKGFGQIRFAQARFGNLCRMCGYKMPTKSFKTLGFTHAKVTFKGVKLINDKEQKFQKQDEESQGKFIFFQDYDQNLCEWIFLNIQVKEIQ